MNDAGSEGIMRNIALSRARAVAASAYLFTYPLVMNYRDMYRQAVDPSSSVFSGGFGTWRHRVVWEPRTSGSGRPREDVLHSSIWLDLRSEPWWFAVGEVPPGVSFVGRIVDLWGFLVGDSVAGFGAHGPVLASAPRPISDVPSGIAGILKGESGFLALHTETRWLDPYQLPGDVPVGPDIVLEPVSVHLGRAAPRPALPMTWWPWHDGREVTDEFWPCVNFALSLTAPNPEDRSILERVAEIGVVRGRPWDSSVLPDEILAAIQEGMDDALNDLLDAASEPGAYGLRDVRREDMDRDYFRRALGALRPLLQ
jgi:hypothetical protein